MLALGDPGELRIGTGETTLSEWVERDESDLGPAFRRKPDKFGASHGNLHRHSSGSSGIAVKNGTPCIWRAVGREGVAGRSAHDRARGKPIVSRVNAVTLLTVRRIIAYDDRNHPVLCLGLFIGSGYVR
jgi:hypothetical protein